MMSRNSVGEMTTICENFSWFPFLCLLTNSLIPFLLIFYSPLYTHRYIHTNPFVISSPIYPSIHPHTSTSTYLLIHIPISPHFHLRLITFPFSLHLRFPSQISLLVAITSDFPFLSLLVITTSTSHSLSSLSSSSPPPPPIPSPLPPHTEEGVCVCGGEEVLHGGHVVHHTREGRDTGRGGGLSGDSSLFTHILSLWLLYFLSPLMLTALYLFIRSPSPYLQWRGERGVHEEDAVWGVPFRIADLLPDHTPAAPCTRVESSVNIERGGVKFQWIPNEMWWMVSEY